MSTLLSINNYYYYRGGAETVFFEQNKLFSALGWRVVPFAMHHPKNLQTEWSRYFVDELEFGEQYSFGQKLVRSAKVIYSREAKQKLARLVDEVHPNICHAHNIYHHISPSILHLLKARGIPTVLTLHDLKIACPAYNMLASDGICERCRGGHLYNALTHRCIKGSTVLSAVVMLESIVHRMLRSYTSCVDRFVVPSRFYIDKLIEWGFSKELFLHIPNFVDAERYAPRYEPGDAFVYFGRLSREKGLVTLIHAAAEAHCRLALIGTGPQVDELKKLAADLGAEVTFHGYMVGDALHGAIKNARAVVLPSEWYENAPMSVLEAYALGKPVIGARIGGIPELIVEGETGATFTSGDANSLAATLRKFIDFPNVRVEAMGRKAREWVETKFTATLYCERISNLYRELGVGTKEASISEERSAQRMI